MMTPRLKQSVKSLENLRINQTPPELYTYSWKDTIHPMYELYELLPSGSQFLIHRTISHIHIKAFIHNAIGLLNLQAPLSPSLNADKHTKTTQAQQNEGQYLAQAIREWDPAVPGNYSLDTKSNVTRFLKSLTQRVKLHTKPNQTISYISIFHSVFFFKTQFST